MDRVAGIQTGGSERAFDVYMKARYLSEQHAGHGVTFATGTPISNTMVEMFTMQRFLDPEGLKSRGLEHFDAWAATFGEVIDTMEISPDGAGLRPRSRFARFTNLPELQQMFRAFSDVQTAEMLDLPRPRLEGGKPSSSPARCPRSNASSSRSWSRVTNGCDHRKSIRGKTTPWPSPPTAASSPPTHGCSRPRPRISRNRKSTAWSRMSHPSGKTTATRGTQMIFCDMGVNPTQWGYSVYDDIIKKLVAGGIPREQIAAIGDAESDAKKQALFEKVRQGSVRVLIGSTQKMGTGTNVQKRLVALHHLDAPWKPAEVEQRDGRILRQGNENEEVAIYRYVTEGSFDAYMWQALETKARFIAQVITGDNAARRAEDIGGQELSYAEVKAIASGNPAVLTLAEADAELQRLTLLKKNHLDEQYVARRNVRDLPADHRQPVRPAGQSSRPTATITDHADDRSPSAATPVPARTRLPSWPKLDALPMSVDETTRIPLGVYRGLTLWPGPSSAIPTERLPRRRYRPPVTLSREHQGPRAVFNALERLAGGYGAECARVRQDLAIAESQLRDYRGRIDQPFSHGEFLSKLTALRDLLKDKLSTAGHDTVSAGKPDLSELAASIKALMAENNVENMPDRPQAKRASAEEPITARIRKRQEANVGLNHVAEQDACLAEPGNQRPAFDEESAMQQPTTFEDRILMERETKSISADAIGK